MKSSQLTPAQRRNLDRSTREGKAPNPKRITFALDARGLYGPEVDIACGVVEPAVDEWEAGTRVPTPAQVVALARLTEFPVGFFYRADPPATEVGYICSRTGPRGQRCVRIDNRPDATVLELRPTAPAQGALR